MSIVTFQFDVQAKGDGCFIKCSLDGESSPETKLDLDFSPDEQLGLKIQKIEDGRCVEDDLRFVGVEFWEKLKAGEAGEFFRRKKSEKPRDAQFHLQFNLPPALHCQPWETLYDYESGFLVCDSRHSIIRGAPDGREPPPFAKRADGPLRILLIVPERSNLPSIDHEIGNINEAASQLRIKPVIEPLTGRVTADLLKQQLDNQQWDIVHYIGHGDVDGDGGVTIRFHADDGSEMMMPAEVFAAHFTRASVRLVVLNCCLGDHALPNRSLSGLGPFLMRKNLPAVVAMRYEIPDPAASKFSLFFYRSLLSSQAMGRVDLAVDSARDALYRNQKNTGVRSFITPVLYLAPAWSCLFELDTAPGANVGAQVVVPPPLLPAELGLPIIPPELAKSLKERQCFVVAGPGILSVGAVRLSAPAPTPRELAALLADDPNDQYPERSDLGLCQQGNEWLSNQLLQWVCGHRSRDQRRGEVIGAIQSTYKKFVPPECLLSMAGWKVPAIFYTHFDGLLERACESAPNSPPWQVFTQIPAKIKLLREGGADFLRLLVQLRGSVSEDDSLILTDEDHELLWDEIRRIDRNLTAEVKRANRCVLFLGTNPRDPLIHRLSQQILDGSLNRKQGPTYFAFSSPTAADKAYWNKYKVHWITTDLCEVIQQINAAAA